MHRLTGHSNKAHGTVRIVSSASVFKFKIIFFSDSLMQDFFCKIMNMNCFQVDLTGISAETNALFGCTVEVTRHWSCT